MADDNSYKFFVLQIFIVMFISFTIEIIIAGYEDETNLITIYQTTAVGSSVELACNVTDNKFGVSWLRDDQGLTLGKVVYQQWQTIYSLNTSRFTNISNHFKYNVVVQNVTETVAGLYICQEQGVKITKVNLSVEVPPVIWLRMGDLNISNEINVTLNEEMGIRCIAVGGKPTVSLLWEINGDDEEDGVTREIVSNGVASTLKYRPKINDRIVTCKASGQIAVPFLKKSVSINVFATRRSKETNQEMTKQGYDTTVPKSRWLLIIVFVVVVSITVPVLTVSIIMKSIASKRASARTRKANESQNVSRSNFNRLQPVSYQEVNDTSGCKYETRIFQEENKPKDFLQGKTESPGRKALARYGPEYLEIMD